MSPIRPGKLTDDDVARKMSSLSNWTLQGGRLHRELEFDTFAAAFGFMASVAIEAQQMDHHPDWSNSHTKVVIDLMSHDVDGLSDRDFELAGIIDSLADRDGD
ncbi:4a-hydroxytetrahydrobiopterin dehydratase [soil metagenome]